MVNVKPSIAALPLGPRYFCGYIGPISMSRFIKVDNPRLDQPVVVNWESAGISARKFIQISKVSKIFMKYAFIKGVFFVKLPLNIVMSPTQ